MRDISIKAGAEFEAQALVSMVNHDAVQGDTIRMPPFSVKVGKIEYAETIMEVDPLKFPAVRDELRRLLQAWVDAKCDPLNARDLVVEVEQRLRGCRAYFRFLAALIEGRPYLFLVPRFVDEEDSAAYVFARFITGSCAGDLKLCPRCKKFFLNTRHRRNKVYCSRKCATGFTAIKATRERLKREKIEKINLTHRAYRQFAKLPKNKRLQMSPVEIKNWIAAQAQVTTRWLTRAINQKRVSPLPDCKDNRMVS